MNPDIDLRLRSLNKALTDVILPALPAHQRLARDQVNLVIGHLNVIAEQWKYALRYELASCELACRLARDLLPELDDEILAKDLEQTLDAIAGMDRTDFDTVSAAHNGLKGLIDRAISAGHVTTPMSARLRQAVLDFNAERATRERTWHRGSGLDPDLATLPPVASLFDRPHEK